MRFGTLTLLLFLGIGPPEEETTFIEFTVADDWVVRRVTTVLSTHTDTLTTCWSSLAPGVNRFRHLVAFPPKAARSNDSLTVYSRSLYQHLFAGLTLSGELHLITDSLFTDLPFTALRKDSVGNKAQYLGTEHALSRQQSVSHWQFLNEPGAPAAYPYPLALAPDFGNAYAAVGVARRGDRSITPLFYNQAEVNAISRIGFGDYRYGRDAFVDVFYEKAPQHGIIHLATHAHNGRFYLLDDAGLPSPVDTHHLAGMILSAGLLTLSACATDRELVNYCHTAGARAVVSANWVIDDRATAEFMPGFYRGIRAGLPAHEALRLARKAYLENVSDPDRAHPYYWAAFSLHGATGPVRWEDGVGWRWWWFGLVVILGAGFARWRRR